MVLVSEFVATELFSPSGSEKCTRTYDNELKSNDMCKKHQGLKRNVDEGKLKGNSFPLSAQNLANSDYR
jgi:hypothetical protein